MKTRSLRLEQPGEEKKPGVRPRKAASVWFGGSYFSSAAAFSRFETATITSALGAPFSMLP